MTPRTILFSAAAASAALSFVAGFAERRRSRRLDMDKVGWVPWTLVQVGAMAVAVMCVGYALKFH